MKSDSHHRSSDDSNEHGGSVGRNVRRDWQPEPAAEALVQGWLQQFCQKVPEAGELAEALSRTTATRLLDWADTIVLADGDCAGGSGGDCIGGIDIETLRTHGFIEVASPWLPHARQWQHPGTNLPSFAVNNANGDNGGAAQLWIRCESVADFAAMHAARPELVVHGASFAPLRAARYCTMPLAAERGPTNAELWAVERHGIADGVLAPTDDMVDVAERLRRRRRHFASDDEAFAHAEALVEDAVERLGADRACVLFFAAEREYWQRRNRAGRGQKARQDALGLGWGNCDHHTYRSSRRHFSRLIALLEKLGFAVRERFYAGREAGWGAQVLEQARASITVFADVDLAPDEVVGDFAHSPLAERHQLGTVGLWCALHGESFLQAGLHHIACSADFAALIAQLQDGVGIATMQPFSDFPHLKQAFTEGERWPVDCVRLSALRESGQVTEDQAEDFAAVGAIGSHLENIERNAGFKGFNQTGISDIIHATDPRRGALAK